MIYNKSQSQHHQSLKLGYKLNYFNFFISYLTAARQTLGHWQGCSFTHPMLITVLFLGWLKGHHKSIDETGSQSPRECILRNSNLSILKVKCCLNVLLSPVAYWLPTPVVSWVQIWVLPTQLNYWALWPSVLGIYNIWKRISLQTISWSLEFVSHNKYWAQ